MKILKIFFSRLKAMAIHIRIFPRRRHIPNSSPMVFLNFVYLRNDGSNQPNSVKSVHFLEPSKFCLFSPCPPILKRFYIIIDNYINRLKILIILSIFRLEICGPPSILSYCNINTLRGKNGQDCRTF